MHLNLPYCQRGMNCHVVMKDTIPWILGELHDNLQHMHIENDETRRGFQLKWSKEEDDGDGVMFSAYNGSPCASRANEEI